MEEGVLPERENPLKMEDDRDVVAGRSAQTLGVEPVFGGNGTNPLSL